MATVRQGNVIQTIQLPTIQQVPQTPQVQTVPIQIQGPNGTLQTVQVPVQQLGGGTVQTIGGQQANVINLGAHVIGKYEFCL